MVSLCMRIIHQLNRSREIFLRLNQRHCSKVSTQVPFEYSARVENKELLVKMDNKESPFDLKIMPRGAGTRNAPNLIPSAFDKRLVGCICNEEAKMINWMWLQKGEAKKCECGYWFNLVHKAPI